MFSSVPFSLICSRTCSVDGKTFPAFTIMSHSAAAFAALMQRRTQQPVNQQYQLQQQSHHSQQPQQQYQQPQQPQQPYQLPYQQPQTHQQYYQHHTYQQPQPLYYQPHQSQLQQQLQQYQQQHFYQQQHHQPPQQPQHHQPPQQPQQYQYTTQYQHRPPPPAPSVPAPTEAQTWYCEPCDKEFTQESAFTAHNAAHEKCQHAGCTFVGTRKIVSAHFLGSHGAFSGTGFTTIEVEGQAFRVLMGTSPEEVQQWRADRRKHFPTAATVQSKREHSEELRSAGGLPAKPQNASKNARGVKRERQPGQKKAVDGETGEHKRARDDAAAAGKQQHQQQQQQLQLQQSQQKQQKQKQQQKGLVVPQPLAGGSRGTLLKKLLEDEISVEENIILQAFRYLRELDFFQQDSKG